MEITAREPSAHRPTRRELLFRSAAQQEAPAPTDEETAAFAEAMELAIADAYATAAATGKLSAPLVQAGNAYASHHREHAAALAGAAGSKATGKAQPRLVDTVVGQLRDAPSEKAVLQILFDLENAAAATYLYAVGAFEGTSSKVLAASILPVESQHAVAIGQAMGKTIDTVVPELENQDRALDPAKYPLTTTTTTTTTATK